jgi:hypothetical protein
MSPILSFLLIIGLEPVFGIYSVYLQPHECPTICCCDFLVQSEYG